MNYFQGYNVFPMFILDLTLFINPHYGLSID